ncbi:hypothetical protein L484_009225 [Morus notabilis]|uniref:Uncharacterized protein n=1 Tax=Morus notabilis TaxID=981085 RepID=W9SJJ9_9ROSA|nr:hypothetical protein L484_009225 [Morus notabilis]
MATFVKVASLHQSSPALLQCRRFGSNSHASDLFVKLDVLWRRCDLSDENEISYNLLHASTYDADDGAPEGCMLTERRSLLLVNGGQRRPQKRKLRSPTTIDVGQDSSRCCAAFSSLRSSWIWFATASRQSLVHGGNLVLNNRNHHER